MDEVRTEPQREKRRLNFEERKFILKWMIKLEKAKKVQQRWQSIFKTTPPTRLTITRIANKFEKHGTIMDIHKGRSGRPRTATSANSTIQIIGHYRKFPKISTRQCSREINFKNSSIRTVLKRLKWRPYVPMLTHKIEDGDDKKRNGFQIG